MVKAQCNEQGGAQTSEGHRAQQLCCHMNIESTNPQNCSCSLQLGVPAHPLLSLLENVFTLSSHFRENAIPWV